MVRLSHSQIDMFKNCKRWYFFNYFKKIPIVSDDRHLRRGSCFHKVAERIINQKIERDKLREEFNREWERLKLNVDFEEKRAETFLMVLNFYDEKIELTSTELKLFNNIPEFVCYIDGVDTNKDIIIDYKTGKEYGENIGYKEQMLRYSLMYYYKFKKLPKQCEIWYVGYSPIKKKIYSFDIKDIMLAEEEIVEIGKFIDNNRKLEDYKKCVEEGKQCNIFCPYTNICNDDGTCLKFTLHYIGNYIQLDGVITELLNKGLIKNFSYELKDAYFIKKNNIHANTTVNFWNLNKRLLPIGFKDRLIKVLQYYASYLKKELIIDIEDHREFDKTVVTMPDKFVNNKTLRDYQEEAVITFKRNKIGVLEIGTGGGKTLIAAEIIRQLQVKTLFIVDKIELLKQTKKVLEESLGIEVGEIGAGEDNIKDISVATVQTLVKHLLKYSKYLQEIRFVIFDETHKVSADSYWKISNYLINTELRMGISGTAFRDDGNDMKIEALAGSKIFDLSSKTLIEKGWLIKPTICFIKDYSTEEKEIEIENKCKIGLINETPNYGNYYKGFICDNEDRNNVVVSLVKQNSDKKILILTKLIEHGEIIKNLIPNSEHLYGATNKEDRKRMMEDFVSGKISVLISTISIFAEGIDIPSLDMVINAAANRGDVKTIQILGRILRIMDGKKEAKYYDFIDNNNFFRVASLARKNILYDEGHYVEVIKYEKPQSI